MELEIYVVRDVIINHSGLVLTATSTPELKRMIKTSLISSKNSPFADHPKDKQIFNVGKLDCSTSVITPNDSAIFVCSVDEIIQNLEMDIALANARKERIKKEAEKVAEMEGSIHDEKQTQ